MSIDFTMLGDVLRRLEDASAHIVMDHNGIILKWSPEAAALFGWNAEEVLGKPLVEKIVPEELRERHNQGLERWHTSQASLIACRRLQTTGRHRDGHLIDVEIGVQVVSEDAGVRFLGWVTRLDQ
jgi:PAS domain S-box-containing protein